MAECDDQADYEAKVEKLHSDEHYAKLATKLNEARMEPKTIRLNPNWVPE